MTAAKITNSPRQSEMQRTLDQYDAVSSRNHRGLPSTRREQDQLKTTIGALRTEISTTTKAVEKELGRTADPRAIKGYRGAHDRLREMSKQMEKITRSIEKAERSRFARIRGELQDRLQRDMQKVQAQLRSDGAKIVRTLSRFSATQAEAVRFEKACTGVLKTAIQSATSQMAQELNVNDERVRHEEPLREISGPTSFMGAATRTALKKVYPAGRVEREAQGRELLENLRSAEILADSIELRAQFGPDWEARKQEFEKRMEVLSTLQRDYDVFQRLGIPAKSQAGEILLPLLETGLQGLTDLAHPTRQLALRKVIGLNQNLDNPGTTQEFAKALVNITRDLFLECGSEAHLNAMHALFDAGNKGEKRLLKLGPGSIASMLRSLHSCVGYLVEAGELTKAEHLLNRVTTLVGEGPKEFRKELADRLASSARSGKLDATLATTYQRYLDSTANFTLNTPEDASECEAASEVLTIRKGQIRALTGVRFDRNSQESVKQVRTAHSLVHDLHQKVSRLKSDALATFNQSAKGGNVTGSHAIAALKATNELEGILKSFTDLFNSKAYINSQQGGRAATAFLKQAEDVLEKSLERLSRVGLSYRDAMEVKVGAKFFGEINEIIGKHLGSYQKNLATVVSSATQSRLDERIGLVGHLVNAARAVGTFVQEHTLTRWTWNTLASPLTFASWVGRSIFGETLPRWTRNIALSPFALVSGCASVITQGSHALFPNLTRGALNAVSWSSAWLIGNRWRNRMFAEWDRQVAAKASKRVSEVTLDPQHADRARRSLANTQKRSKAAGELYVKGQDSLYVLKEQVAGALNVNVSVSASLTAMKAEALRGALSKFETDIVRNMTVLLKQNMTASGKPEEIAGMTGALELITRGTKDFKKLQELAAVLAEKRTSSQERRLIAAFQGEKAKDLFGGMTARVEKAIKLLWDTGNLAEAQKLQDSLKGTLSWTKDQFETKSATVVNDPEKSSAKVGTKLSNEYEAAKRVCDVIKERGELKPPMRIEASDVETDPKRSAQPAPTQTQTPPVQSSVSGGGQSSGGANPNPGLGGGGGMGGGGNPGINPLGGANPGGGGANPGGPQSNQSGSQRQGSANKQRPGGGNRKKKGSGSPHKAVNKVDPDQEVTEISPEELEALFEFSPDSDANGVHDNVTSGANRSRNSEPGVTSRARSADDDVMAAHRAVAREWEAEDRQKAATQGSVSYKALQEQEEKLRDRMDHLIEIAKVKEKGAPTLAAQVAQVRLEKIAQELKDNRAQQEAVIAAEVKRLGNFKNGRGSEERVKELAANLARIQDLNENKP